MNIYLDIDGVLLTKQGQPAEYVLEFLKHTTEKHACYWLTTHCKGNSATVIAYLENKLPQQAMQYIYKIKPTNWQTWKTEAIDLTTDFRWIDDYILEFEKQILLKQNILDKFVQINLIAEPHQLKKLML